MMKRNIGTTDKIIRLIIAIILIVIYFTGIVEGTWAIIFPIAAIVLAITTITGFCGLYPLFGINTCKIKDKK